MTQIAYKKQIRAFKSHSWTNSQIQSLPKMQVPQMHILQMRVLYLFVRAWVFTIKACQSMEHISMQIFKNTKENFTQTSALFYSKLFRFFFK